MTLRKVHNYITNRSLKWNPQAKGYSKGGRPKFIWKRDLQNEL